MEKKYAEFASYYEKSGMSQRALEAVLTILNMYRQAQFVSDVVLQRCISYVQIAFVFLLFIDFIDISPDCSISKGTQWQLLRAHVPELMQTVIFPLLRHNDDDEALWEESHKDYHNENFGYLKKQLSGDPIQ